MKYPKIETLFVRNEKTHGVEQEIIRRPEFGIPKWWYVEEKIDGTNCRVILDGDGSSTIRGRTDAATWNPKVLVQLEAIFDLDTLKEVLWRGCEGDVVKPTVILYGEAYGPKIQKGGNYRDDVSFRLFDVLFVNPVGQKTWLNRDSVCDIAEKLGIKTAPYLGDWGIHEIVDLVKGGATSVVSEREGGNKEYQMEGVICRTEPLLLMKSGKRLMFKLKTKDWK